MATNILQEDESPPLPRGITRLYLLETKGVHQLAACMQTLKTVLDAMKNEPPQPWNVEIAYKTIRVKVSGRDSDDKPQTTGESLYVVKSTEFQQRTYMMATKVTPTVAGVGNRASTPPAATAKEGGGAKTLSPVVETGALGDEIVCILKGYTNRLTLTIEGTMYKIGGGMFQAGAGFFNRGNTLTSLALQVRYENEHCSIKEAHRVIEEFVKGALTGQEEGLKVRVVEEASSSSSKSKSTVSNNDSSSQVPPPPSSAASSILPPRLPGTFGPKHTTLQYIELFSMT